MEDHGRPLFEGIANILTKLPDYATEPAWSLMERFGVGTLHRLKNPVNARFDKLSTNGHSTCFDKLSTNGRNRSP
jgi:hypothetical protein